MSEQYCQICKQIFDGNTSTLELYDATEKVLISGHDECATELMNRIKGVKDLDKKPVKKVLKEVKFES